MHKLSRKIVELANIYKSNNIHLCDLISRHQIVIYLFRFVKGTANGRPCPVFMSARLRFMVLQASNNMAILESVYHSTLLNHCFEEIPNESLFGVLYMIEVTETP